MSGLSRNERLRALQVMRRTVANDHNGVIAPRTLAALALPVSVALVLLGAFGEAVLTFYVGKHFAHYLPASWRERLDAQLAAYIALDTAVFEMRRRQATSGWLDNLRVLCWLSVEQAALCPRPSVLPRWRIAERT